jgi:hypothetical protein
MMRGLRSLTIQSKSRVEGPYAQNVSRNLNIMTLALIPFGTSNDQRERNVLMFNGIKLALAIRNTTTEQKIFRWAVIMPKTCDNDITINFFKGFESERGLNFDTNRDGLQMVDYPINTAIHTVIAQGRYSVGGTTYNTNQSNEINVNRYVPIKKKLTYDQTGSTGPMRNIYLATWYDNHFSGGGQATGSGLDYIMKATQFFHDAI